MSDEIKLQAAREFIREKNYEVASTPGRKKGEG
jgi:hypothetical protein